LEPITKFKPEFNPDVLSAIPPKESAAKSILYFYTACFCQHPVAAELVIDEIGPR